jgi:two-component system sensor histidine kinase KdpD
VAAGRPVGLLALHGEPSGGEGLLRAFANHLALALLRSQLQEQAVRAGLLEEVDRLRRGLVGAVSHDLRTPLATIKVAASALLDADAPVSNEDERELLGLIDGQVDRLDHLVANLLDMTRIQAGSLELRRAPVAIGELLEEARSRLGRSADLERVVACIPDDLPEVDVDRVLIAEALANLLDNAVRYSPADRPVTVAADSRRPGKVLVSVSDRGPGLSPADDLVGVLESIGRREAGGAGGLGLAIVQAFVEVHGERVWVEPVPGGGTRVVLSLPVAAV